LAKTVYPIPEMLFMHFSNIYLGQEWKGVNMKSAGITSPDLPKKALTKIIGKLVISIFLI
jgi:hypothetical protein